MQGADRQMETTLVIGDVHGCVDELRALVRLVPDVPVVLTGDLVAKGPDSRGVLAFAREISARSVLGNHDAHVLGLRDDRGRGERARKEDKRAEHRALAETLSTKDWDFLSGLPLWLRLGRGRGSRAGWVVVHGGLLPGVALEKQERETCLVLRSIRPDGTPSKRLEPRPWAEVWRGPEHAVFGHDAVRGLQRHPFATGLDTGCVYGGRLTGLLLPEGRLVSVPARRTYVDVK